MAMQLENNWSPDFDAISCYRDEDVPQALSQLINCSDFQKMIDLLDHSPTDSAHKDTLQSLRRALPQLNNLQDIQDWVADHFLPRIARGYSSFTSSGLNTLNSDSNYLFVSNHRDIVMDPLLLNVALRDQGFAPTQCAIGDNLLVNHVANSLARLNRCFTVIRSHQSPKAMLRSMKIQSAYIAYVLNTAKQNIWIAQKEGRAKDNRDITNPALLKMLTLCRDKSQSHASILNEMKIVPVSLSYEFDPCDVIKARQLRSKETEQNYVKSAREDLEAVLTGLQGDKGRIHVHFDQPMLFSDAESVADMAGRIDASIHRHYKIFPVNYAAEQLLNAAPLSDEKYENKDVEKAARLLDQRLEGQPEDIRHRVIKAYATPLEAYRNAVSPDL